MNDVRKMQDWIDENDVPTQFDSYYISELEERRRKILEETQRHLRYESLIENYDEQLEKTLEEIAELHPIFENLKKEVYKQKDLLKTIWEEIERAQTASDQYEKDKRKNMVILRRLEEELITISDKLTDATNMAIQQNPIRPDEIPLDEERERVDIDVQRTEYTKNADLLLQASDIKQNYKSITEVRLSISLNNI